LVSTFDELGGRVQYLRRLVDKDDKTWSAFNPSIGVSDSGSLAVAIRSSNYVILPHGELHVTVGGPIRNRVWFAELSETFTLENLRQIDFSQCGTDFSRGVEDPKLLWRDKRWLLTGVAMEKRIPVARNCIVHLDKKATKAEKVEIIPGFESRRPEKNWMTAGNKPKNFDYIYDGNGIVKGDRVIHRLRDNKETSALRGNAHLVEMSDGTYLGVMHTLRTTKKMQYIPSRFMTVDNVQKIYEHVFVRFDTDGWIVEKSEPFHLVAPGIEFVAGFIAYGDDYILSFGKEDVSSHLGIISKAKVHKMMKRV
jgi:hypothetical protein